MEIRYSRNRIYLSDEEQATIKNCPILMAGCGIGSVIAECALRLGFENITIIDGDHVELSNLNRQNYIESDVVKLKTDAIKKRLKAINGNAKITVHNCFLTIENVELYLQDQQIAINALDFTTELPLKFDEICQRSNIPVLHPYNLGWGGLVTIIDYGSPLLGTLLKPNERFSEINMVEYACGQLELCGNPKKWIRNTIEKYREEMKGLPPPQLSIGSWTVAAMCTHLLFNIATKKEFKKFPEFYLSTVMNVIG